MLSIALISLIIAQTILLGACRMAPTPSPTPTIVPSPRVDQPGPVRAWHQAAIAEGLVRAYVDLSPEETEELTKLFRRRYPDVSIVWVRGLDRELARRALVETRDGSPSFDLFLGDLGTYLASAGLAERWAPPEGRALSSELIGAEGTWHAVAVTYHVLQYNIEQVAPSARPRGYAELADPHYLGRLASDDEALGWLKGMIETHGRQTTIDMLRPLSEQGVASLREPRVLSQMIGVGRYAVAINNRLDAVERDRRWGAKTAWVALEPVITQPTALVVSNRAQHPNAARLLANFLLSADAQIALAERGRVPARQDVDPEPYTLVRGIRTHLTLPPEGAAEDELRALYREVWRPR